MSEENVVAAGPVIRVLGQFAKTLKFESAGGAYALGMEKMPAIDLGIDVASTKQDGAPDVYETLLTVTAIAKLEDKVAFQLELVYGALVGLETIPDDQLEPILMIDCPKLLFPYARRIVSEITRDGGFPPLLIDPVNFEALYMQQRAQNS